jgi:hypothetical protein
VSQCWWCNSVVEQLPSMDKALNLIPSNVKQQQQQQQQQQKLSQNKPSISLSLSLTHTHTHIFLSLFVYLSLSVSLFRSSPLPQLSLLTGSCFVTQAVLKHWNQPVLLLSLICL